MRVFIPETPGNELALKSNSGKCCVSGKQKGEKGERSQTIGKKEERKQEGKERRKKERKEGRKGW